MKLFVLYTFIKCLFMYEILNWMDGERKSYPTEKKAKEEFERLKKEYQKENAEFDMILYKIIDEYNNVS